MEKFFQFNHDSLFVTVKEIKIASHKKLIIFAFYMKYYNL